MGKWLGGSGLFPRVESGRFQNELQSFSRVLLPIAVLLIASHATAALSNSDQPAVVVLSSDVGRPQGHCTAFDMSARNPGACEHLVDRRVTLAVPEPASLLLVGTGLLSIAAVVRKRIIR